MAALTCFYQALLGIITVLSLVCSLNAQAATQPLSWPLGTYGLPMPRSGCPNALGFQWKTGMRFEDLEDTQSQTRISPNSHFQTRLSDGDLFRYFCVKSDDSAAVDTDRPLWPFGKFCIYKKGRWCPIAFSEGWVFRDDENGANGSNRNYHTGTLPAGVYKNNTKMFFCCQDMGTVSSPISLPTERPFYLIAFKGPECQEVYGTRNSLERIVFDTEDIKNKDKQGGLFPVGADSVNNPTINYCYYQACRWTFTALNGTLWTPGYPKHYKKSHHCQWYIRVPIIYSISLVFLEFKLEDTPQCMDAYCTCDRVDISEVFPNGSESAVGVYCMGVRFPTRPIVSNSNTMVVRFTPDESIQSEGFRAEYSAVLKKVPTTPTTDTTQTTTGFPQTNPSTITNGTNVPPTSNTTTTRNPSSQATSPPQTTPSNSANTNTEQKISSAASGEHTDSTATGATPGSVPEDTTATHTMKPLEGRNSQSRSSGNSTTVAVICVLVFVAVAATTLGVSVFFWKRRAQLDIVVFWDKTQDKQEIEQSDIPLYDSSSVDGGHVIIKENHRNEADKVDSTDGRESVDTDVSSDKKDIKETENPLYDSRENLMRDLREDRRTEPADCETDNPLYASTCQRAQLADSQLYESMDSIQDGDVTTVTDNPLYSRLA